MEQVEEDGIRSSGQYGVLILCKTGLANFIFGPKPERVTRWRACQSHAHKSCDYRCKCLCSSSWPQIAVVLTGGRYCDRTGETVKRVPLQDCSTHSLGPEVLKLLALTVSPRSSAPCALCYQLLLWVSEEVALLAITHMDDDCRMLAGTSSDVHLGCLINHSTRHAEPYVILLRPCKIQRHIANPLQPYGPVYPRFL